MGMFGVKKPSVDGDKLDPSQLSGSDKLMLIGATLRDVGSGLRGDQGDAIANAQALLVARQQQAQKQAFASLLAGKLAPQYAASPDIQVGTPSVTGQATQGNAAGYQYQAPQRTSDGLNINSPDLPSLALAAQNAHYDMSPLMDVLKAQQPNIQYDRGFGYDQKTGKSAGGYHPDLDKGQEPLFDGSGRIVAVRNMDGSVQSAAEMAGAVEGAKAAAQAPYQSVQTYAPDGRPMTINARQLAAGANGQGAPFLGQSPAQTAADTARATAGASADINLPQALSTGSQAIQLIDSLKTHPGLKARTGLTAMLPAIPGTQGADFDALSSQLKGKVFLQAYGDLKGAGAITENEGRAATQAIGRLNQTQSTQGYVKALNDLETVIKSGMQRSQGQAQRLKPNAAATSGAPPRAAIEAELRRRGLLH